MLGVPILRQPSARAIAHPRRALSPPSQRSAAMLGVTSQRTPPISVHLAEDIQVVKQLSKTACIHNESFGVGHGGIVWVASGCRAKFVLADGTNVSCGWSIGGNHQRCMARRGPRPSPPAVRLPDRARVVRVRPSETCDATDRRPRLAYQLSGCLRDLAHTTPFRVEALTGAVEAGFAVDLFCALEECSESKPETAEHVRRFVRAFVGAARQGGCVRVECAWWGADDGVLERTSLPRSQSWKLQLLKPEYRAAHPDYPYAMHLCRRGVQCSVDNTLSQAHKLAVVGSLREAAALKYALVWRTRPDFYTTGHRWALIRKTVRVWSSQQDGGRTHGFLARAPSERPLVYTSPHSRHRSHHRCSPSPVSRP